jgi:hypothetical protein
VSPAGHFADRLWHVEAAGHVDPFPPWKWVQESLDLIERGEVSLFDPKPSRRRCK